MAECTPPIPPSSFSNWATNDTAGTTSSDISTPLSSVFDGSPMPQEDSVEGLGDDWHTADLSFGSYSSPTETDSDSSQMHKDQHTGDIFGGPPPLELGCHLYL